MTGSAGFFGSAVVSRLREMGHYVVGADLQVSDGRGTELLDITSASSCEDLFSRHRGLDTVVHAAAIAHVSPGKLPESAYHRVNVEGTKNVVDAAVRSNVKHFVLISSVTVYGEYDLENPVPDGAPRKGESIYGRTKVLAEDVVTASIDDPCVHILRPASMYSTNWLFNVRKRVVLPIVGRFFYCTTQPLRRRFSLCSRQNAVESVLWAVEQRIPAGVYNVADQYDYSQREILDAVASVEGEKRSLGIPAFVAWTARRLLGWCGLHSAVLGRAYANYWKFCESNRYSTAKLRKYGLKAPPHLLALSRRSGCATPESASTV